jgi:hypothetical protein
VNLFAPPQPVPDPEAVQRYARALGDRYGGPLGEPRHDDDGWEAKLALVAELRVPIVSFTFGCPPADVVARLHDAGAAVWATVTTPLEARIAERAGADALVVQGAEAGGHRATFDDTAPTDLGLLAALQLIAGRHVGAAPPRGRRRRRDRVDALLHRSHSPRHRQPLPARPQRKRTARLPRRPPHHRTAAQGGA